VDSDSVRLSGWKSFESVWSIEQPPGHGSDLVKGLECSFGLCAVDSTSLLEEPEVAVDLLGRGVGDLLRALGMVTSGSFMRPLKAVRHSMSRVLRTGLTGLPLTLAASPATSPIKRPGGDHHGLADADHCPGILLLPLSPAADAVC